jgi:hypothetical protein
MRIATMISRRSRAIGWRLAMVRIARSSSSSSSASIFSSLVMTTSASLVSRLASASIALAR